MPDQHHIELCALDELADGQARGFPATEQSGNRPIFIIRREDAVYGYINSCPHTGAPLEWLPNQFLSLDGKFVQCALHGARFQIHDGLCVDGPCINDTLTPIKIDIKNGHIFWSTS